jgi:hypothetical protein
MANYVEGIDFSGRDVYYGVAVESTRGTPVNPYFALRWETADFEDKATTVLNKSALGVLNQDSGAEMVEQWGEGQIAGKVTDRAIGVLFYGLQGAYGKSTAPGETIVYNHVFTASQQNALQSLTVTRKDPNVTEQWAESIVGSMAIDVKAGDFVRHTTNLISQPSSVITTTPHAYVSEEEFVSRHVTAQFNNTYSGLTTAPAVPVESLKLEVNNNVTPFWIIGQNNPYNIFAQSTVITGEIVLLYDTNEFKNLRFTTGTNADQSVLITLKNTNVTIGVASNPTITFTMPSCFLTDWKVENSLDSLVKQSISFNAVFSLDLGFALNIAQTSLVSSYQAAPSS